MKRSEQHERPTGNLNDHKVHHKDMEMDVPDRVEEHSPKGRNSVPFPQDYVLGDQGSLFASKMPADLDLNRQDPVGSSRV